MEGSSTSNLQRNRFFGRVVFDYNMPKNRVQKASHLAFRGESKMLVLNMIYGNCSSLYMERPTRIGKGLMVVHGNGTVIGGGAAIGNNLTIYQNATIGFQNGFPTIGDNVFIGAGVIVIGKIKVGTNVKIGAGAVVVNDVPDNCTVVGPKAKVLANKFNDGFMQKSDNNIKEV